MIKIVENKNKSLKESNLGSDVAKYQKWVDYDMKRYGRVSQRTQKFVKDAGLSIVKDDHNQYEVIADTPDTSKKYESLKESAAPDDIRRLLIKYSKGLSQGSPYKEFGYDDVYGIDLLADDGSAAQVTDRLEKDGFKLVDSYEGERYEDNYYVYTKVDNGDKILATVLMNEVDPGEGALVLQIAINPEDEELGEYFNESLKESYYDSISISRLNDIRDTIDELIEEMDNNGISEIRPSPNTYGMTNFIGTSQGYIDLDRIYDYAVSDEDEDEELGESLKESLRESFTVELYKDRTKDPERLKFKDYRSAMKFAKSHVDNCETIMITRPDINGPSVVNSYERDSGWYKEESLKESIDDFAGDTFIEDGVEYEWITQYGDEVEIGTGTWAVWEASPVDSDDDNPETYFFVVDVEDGFIDWGPCDTLEEASEFLESKESDEDKEEGTSWYDDEYDYDAEYEKARDEKLFGEE